ncbi:glycosyltransferase family 1 protein [Persicobacter diffluens]|uniref:Glycosyl transferase n=1 Tax=Persicobacter diffluens TaxID=981 RepID=A0AAN4VZB9_9BACT|nr:glycosyl transferase [Persicobacter diffluens]
MGFIEKIIFDARMVRASGIGVYVSNVLPFFKNYNTKMKLIGRHEKLNHFNLDVVQYEREAVYDLVQHILLPRLLNKADMIFFPHFNVPFFLPLNRNIFVTIHDVFHLDNPDLFSKVKYWYAKLLYWNAVKKATHIFTVSEFSKERLIYHFPQAKGKITTVYNGVNVSAFQSATPLESSDFERLSIPDKYLLFVGNVKPHKNLKGLLEAYALLPEAIKATYPLVIVGKKDGFLTGDDILPVIEKLGLMSNIHFTGYVADEDLYRIYKSAHLFVFPSLYEGFGLPPMEALASGVPAVVSDIPVLREVYGDHVLYADAANPTVFAEAILKGISEEALRTACLNGKEQLFDKYNWEITAQKMIAIIERESK